MLNRIINFLQFLPLVLLVMVGCQSANNQKQPTDLIKQKLKGKIKTINEFVLRIDQNNVLKDTISTNSITFNKLGYAIKEVKTTQNKTLKKLYERDDKFNIIQQLTMDENDAVLLTENYFYDNLQLKTVEQINQNGKTLIEYFYDDNDSLIEESRSANGSEFSLTKYAYFEEDGLKITHQSNYFQSKNKAQKIIQKFNGQNRTNETTYEIYNSDQPLEPPILGSILKVKMDENWHLSSMESINAHSISSFTTVKYEYDEMENWIKREHFTDGQLAVLIVRKIHYF